LDTISSHSYCGSSKYKSIGAKISSIPLAGFVAPFQRSKIYAEGPDDPADPDVIPFINPIFSAIFFTLGNLSKHSANVSGDPHKPLVIVELAQPYANFEFGA
jgi:hypothetical protein